MLRRGLRSISRQSCPEISRRTSPGTCTRFWPPQLYGTCSLHGRALHGLSEHTLPPSPTSASSRITFNRPHKCGTGTLLAAASSLPAVTDPAAAAWVLTPEMQLHFPHGEFSIEMQVRDYELDQYGVLNNAVYASYFQHARHEALVALGHDADEYARAGTPLALSQLNITYRAPLRSRDVCRVTVAINRITPARLVFHQRIFKRRRSPGGVQDTAGDSVEEMVAEAEAVVVFLDSNYRPIRIPKTALRLFQAVADLAGTAKPTA